MKDKNDTQTRDAFRSQSNAERQRAYRARQRAAGRKLVQLWLTDEEHEFVRTVLNLNRKGE